MEQILTTVNIAIRRALFQLEYYREGSIPDAFGTLPKEWSTDQIKGFSDWFQSITSGQLGERRKLKFMPDGFKYQETKQPPLKDEYDEWLARIICFAFSISPQPFIKQMNRATATTAHDTAMQEGLMPLQRWVKGIIDPVIALEFDSPDLEFAWADDREQDPMQADTILVNDTKAGIISIDEAREAKGLDPLGGAASIPMALTANGYVAIDPEERAAMTPAPGAATGEGGQNTEAGHETIPENDNKPGRKGGNKPHAADESSPDGNKETKTAQKAAYSRLRKAVRPEPVPFDRKVTRKACADLKPKVARILKAAGEDIASQVADKLGKLAKGDEDNKDRAERITLGLDLKSLDVLIDVVPDDLESVLADSGNLALAQIGIADRGELVNQVNERAVESARQRAAEMVGKRWVDGELVDNPDAQWRIDESTRDELRTVIERGLEDNIGSDAIARAIGEAGAFSEERAELIANTEIARANSVGALNGYKAAREAGVTVQKQWLPDSDPCEEICQPNVDAGAIDLDEEFPSGDTEPPGHPHCECSLVPVVTHVNGEESEEDEE